MDLQPFSTETEQSAANAPGWPDATEPTGDGELAARVGTSGNVGEHAVEDGLGVRVGLLGPYPGGGALSDRAVAVSERVMAAAMGGKAPLAEVAAEVDLALRHAFSPVDPDGRATIVLAAVSRSAIRLGWTGQGGAYLVRADGGLEVVEAGGDAYVGGRTTDAGEARIRVVEPNWRLGPDARLVLATRRLSPLLGPAELSDLAFGGHAEAAAQAIAAVASVRALGDEIGIAVIQCSATDAFELDAAGDHDHLLGALEAVIRDFDKESPTVEPGGDPDPDDVPTEGFAPVRTRFPTGDADVLYEDEREDASPTGG